MSPFIRNCVCAISLCFSVGVALGCRQEVAEPELPPRAIQWLRVSGAVSGDQRVISGIVTAVSDTSLAFEVGGIVESYDLLGVQ